MNDNEISVRLPEPRSRADLDADKRYLYCTARPGDDVSPAVRPLIVATFWADLSSPRDRVRYREVVSAAERFLRPQAAPWATSDERRKVARRFVREVLAIPGSPIVATYAEWETKRHA